jgi:hypothetical protein
MHAWRFVGGRLVITVLDAWKWCAGSPDFLFPGLGAEVLGNGNVKSIGGVFSHLTETGGLAQTWIHNSYPKRTSMAGADCSL